MKLKMVGTEAAFVFITFLAGIVANTSPLDKSDKNIPSGPVSYPSDPPMVLYILRSDPEPYPPPTSAGTVDFDVTFSEDVTDVDVDDFTLTTTGITNPFVANVRGLGNVYVVTINTGTGNGTIRLDMPASATIKDLAGNSLSDLPFTSGEVYWIVKLATFTDVASDYWAWSYIEWLYATGITSGCGTNPLIYCPTTTVTRDQMSVFLLRGMHGSAYTPFPVGGSTGFADVSPDHWAAAWIKELANEGITSGCGSGNYCPNNDVTRDQMAVFLLKSKHGSAYVPPAATGVFQDVPQDYWAASWIEQLAAEGITSGCSVSPKQYCPTTPVTRDQMAVFLIKTFK